MPPISPGACSAREPWRPPPPPAGQTLSPDTPPDSTVQVKRVFCESSGALVPKDKAVKRFIVRNIVESAAIRDLQESCVFDCASRRPAPPCCPAGQAGAAAPARRRSLQSASQPGVAEPAVPEWAFVFNPKHSLISCLLPLPPQPTCCPSFTARSTTQSPPPSTPRCVRGSPWLSAPTRQLTLLLPSPAGGARAQPRGAPHPRAAQAFPAAGRKEAGRAGRPWGCGRRPQAADGVSGLWGSPSCCCGRADPRPPACKGGALKLRCAALVEYVHPL